MDIKVLLSNYLLLHVGLFLALRRPGFLRSLTRASLLSVSAALSVGLIPSSPSTNALANHSLIASDCPAIHHPLITISASKDL